MADAPTIHEGDVIEPTCGTIEVASERAEIEREGAWATVPLQPIRQLDFRPSDSGVRKNGEPSDRHGLTERFVIVEAEIFKPRHSERMDHLASQAPVGPLAWLYDQNRKAGNAAASHDHVDITHRRVDPLARGP